jgi:hypothetical protein
VEIPQNKANDPSRPALWLSENCNLGRKHLSGNVSVANEITSFRILSTEDSIDSNTL